MSTINWKPGPAKTRDGREARIYATDGGGKKPIHGAIKKGCDFWEAHDWRADGGWVTFANGALNDYDLLPPKLSRDEVAVQCCRVYAEALDAMHLDLEIIPANAMRATLDHYDHLRREGLCDE